MVDGDAARALGEIARDRWHRSTGTRIADSLPQSDIWPDRVTPDFQDLSVAISRTDARLREPIANIASSRQVEEDGNGSLEIEQLHLDLIAAARDHIYIETQYLTNATIVTALCRRLEEAAGPEVVMVLPLKNTGWLEEHTIEGLRSRSIRQLRAADRFKVCASAIPWSPIATRPPSECIRKSSLSTIGYSASARQTSLIVQCD